MKYIAAIMAIDKESSFEAEGSKILIIGKNGRRDSASLNFFEFKSKDEVIRVLDGLDAQFGEENENGDIDF